MMTGTVNGNRDMMTRGHKTFTRVAAGTSGNRNMTGIDPEDDSSRNEVCGERGVKKW